MSEHRIKSYYEGTVDEKTRVLDWIGQRTKRTEIEAGIYVFNYTFSMDELINFIKDSK